MEDAQREGDDGVGGDDACVVGGMDCDGGRVGVVDGGDIGGEEEAGVVGFEECTCFAGEEVGEATLIGDEVVVAGVLLEGGIIDLYMSDLRS